MSDRNAYYRANPGHPMPTNALAAGLPTGPAPQSALSQWTPDRLSEQLPIAFDNALAYWGVPQRDATDWGHRLSGYVRYGSPIGMPAEALDTALRAGRKVWNGQPGDAAADVASTAAAYAAKKLGPGGSFVGPDMTMLRDRGPAAIYNLPGYGALGAER